MRKRSVEDQALESAVHEEALEERKRKGNFEQH